MKFAGILLAFSSLLSCSDRNARGDTPAPSPALRDVTLLGRYDNLALVEASGIVRSTREPNVYWSQNDSGNDEYLFAFDSTGHAVGAVRVKGSKNRDWEAIALGPCTSGSCLYIGDVGDNLARHDDVRIWRVPEPLSTDTVTETAVRLTFRYPDGPRDVESMWVTPDTSIYLLSKRPARDSASQLMPARLYRVEADSWQISKGVIATFVETMPIVPAPGDPQSWITDAALSAPDSVGRAYLAVRTYRDVYVFATDSVTLQPTALVGECSLRVLQARNGEGVAWMADGRLIFNSEGSRSRLYAGRCP